MADSWRRKPLIDQTIHPFPSDLGFLASSSKRGIPQSNHLVAKGLQGAAVHGDSVVAVVSGYHRVEPLTDIRHALVHSLSEFVFHLFEFVAKPLLDGLADHRV